MHIHSLKISLHGSLAATGLGHMTPHAVLLGLMGEDPETVQVGRLARVMDEVRSVREIDLGTSRVKFDLERDLVSRICGTSLMKDLALESAAGSSKRSAIHGVRRKGGYDRNQRIFLGGRGLCRE